MVAETFRIDQDIGWFDISVHDAGGMNKLHCPDNLIREAHNVYVLERTGSNKSRQITVHPFEHKIDLVDRVESGWRNHFEQRDDILVSCQMPAYLDLSQSSHCVDVIHFLYVDDLLDRHLIITNPLHHQKCLHMPNSPVHSQQPAAVAACSTCVLVTVSVAAITQPYAPCPMNLGLTYRSQISNSTS